MGSKTVTARRQVRAPIYLDGFNKPLSEIVQDIRSDLATARGKLADIGDAFPLWRGRLEDAEGLLTCGVIALHRYMEEMREYEKQWPDGPGAVRIEPCTADAHPNSGPSAMRSKSTKDPNP